MLATPRAICRMCGQSVSLDAQGKYIKHDHFTESGLCQECRNSGEVPPPELMGGLKDPTLGYVNRAGEWPKPEEPPSPARFPTQTLYARINGVDVTFLVEHKMPVDFFKLPTIKLVVDGGGNQKFTFGGVDVG